MPEDTVLAVIKKSGSRVRITPEELEGNPDKYTIEEDQGCEGPTLAEAKAAKAAAG